MLTFFFNKYTYIFLYGIYLRINTVATYYSSLTFFLFVYIILLCPVSQFASFASPFYSLIWFASFSSWNKRRIICKSRTTKMQTIQTKTNKIHLGIVNLYGFMENWFVHCCYFILLLFMNMKDKCIVSWIPQYPQYGYICPVCALCTLYCATLLLLFVCFYQCFAAHSQSISFPVSWTIDTSRHEMYTTYISKTVETKVIFYFFGWLCYNLLFETINDY